METPLLTIKQVAEALNCSRQTVRNLIASGELEVIQIGKSAKSDRVDPRELEQFKIRRRRNRSLAAATPPKVRKLPPRDTERELDRLLQ